MAEKYTQWADRGSGVNPFVPGEISLPKQTLPLIGRYAVAAAVALPRIAVAAGVSLLYLITQFVMNELFLFIVYTAFLWMCKSGQVDTEYLAPYVYVLVVRVTKNNSALLFLQP